MSNSQNKTAPSGRSHNRAPAARGTVVIACTTCSVSLREKPATRLAAVLRQTASSSSPDMIPTLNYSQISFHCSLEIFRLTLAGCCSSRPRLDSSNKKLSVIVQGPAVQCSCRAVVNQIPRSAMPRFRYRLSIVSFHAVV